MTETTVWDAADYLDTPEDIASYLRAAFETTDAELIAAALGDVSRAKGMSAIARNAGVTREALYKGLTASGDPKLSTLVGVVRALGLQLQVVPAAEDPAA